MPSLVASRCGRVRAGAACEAQGQTARALFDKPPNCPERRNAQQSASTFSSCAGNDRRRRRGDDADRSPIGGRGRDRALKRRARPARPLRRLARRTDAARHARRCVRPRPARVPHATADSQSPQPRDHRAAHDPEPRQANRGAGSGRRRLARVFASLARNGRGGRALVRARPSSPPCTR
jgi:hypothetical protein